MSKYTTEVRFICESACNLDESAGLDKVNEIIEQARPTIFDKYPIFDETYRNVLETKILRHYYTREICAETPALWKLWLNNRMNEIMPYYNQLYNSALLEFNPLYDVDLYRKHDANGSTSQTGNKENLGSQGYASQQNTNNTTTSNLSSNTNASTSTTNTSDADNWELRQDTPQGGLQGVEDLEYLTEANKRTNHQLDTGSTTNTSGTTNTGTVTDAGTSNETRSITSSNTENSTNNIQTVDAYLEHVYGKQGSSSYSKLLQDYRNTFLNIDTMVIENLKDLFFNLW